MGKQVSSSLEISELVGVGITLLHSYLRTVVPLKVCIRFLEALAVGNVLVLQGFPSNPFWVPKIIDCSLGNPQG